MDFPSVWTFARIKQALHDRAIFRFRVLEMRGCLLIEVPRHHFPIAIGLASQIPFDMPGTAVRVDILPWWRCRFVQWVHDQKF